MLVVFLCMWNLWLGSRLEYMCECFELSLYQMATCKEGRRPGETKAAKPEREAVLVAAENHQVREKFIRSYPQKTSLLFQPGI